MSVIDGQATLCAGLWTILEACRSLKIDTPTLCYLENLTPVNVCRICVVELTGARRWCRPAPGRSNPGWKSKPTRPGCGCHARWCSNSWAHPRTCRPLRKPRPTSRSYARRPHGPSHPPARAGERDGREAGHTTPPTDVPPRPSPAREVDNDLYVRDYSKCILCYKCVEACGTDARTLRDRGRRPGL